MEQHGDKQSGAHAPLIALNKKAVKASAAGYRKHENSLSQQRMLIDIKRRKRDFSRQVGFIADYRLDG
jgi:hypothetical protein